MRFIHTGDVHLGAEPDFGMSWSKKRAKDLWDSFERLIQNVKKERTDLLIIAGDLFHRQPLLRELKEVNYLFSKIPDTQVVLIAGNHDYLKKNSCYLDYSWASNVHGLWKETCEELYIPELHTWVYGCSYHQREIRSPIYDEIRPNGQSGHHILIAHGGDENHAPMNYKKLQAAGFDYVALGHIHKPQVFQEKRMAYAGALEPIDKNDLGTHGYIRGICQRKGSEIEFVPFAVCSYEVLDITSREHTTQYELEQKVKTVIEERNPENIYKIHISGEHSEGMRFDTDAVKRLGNIVEVKDETHTAYDLDRLADIYRGSLIGNYIERFRGTVSETEKKALYYGIEALLQAKR